MRKVTTRELNRESVICPNCGNETRGWEVYDPGNGWTEPPTREVYCECGEPLVEE